MIVLEGDLRHANHANHVMELPPAGPFAQHRWQREWNEVQPDIQHAIQAAIGAVPGLSVASMTTRQQTPQGYEIEIGVEGWSPSLHRLSMQWVITMTGVQYDRDPTLLAHRIKQAENGIALYVKTQLQRARDAANIGITSPLAALDAPAEVDHLTADRSALALTALYHGTHTRMVLGKGVSRLHREAIDNRGGSILSALGIMVVDELGTQHLRWSVSFPRTSDETHVELFDDTLYITGTPIPETLAIALAGRPLEAVASIHPMLDKRIIAEATINPADSPSAQPNLAIRLVPDRVRIGDLG